MPVLIEALSIVIRADRLQAKFPGGWVGFQLEVVHPTLCGDGELVRIGFMHSDDVSNFVGDLEAIGLRYVVEDAAGRRAEDMVVVDQHSGPMVAADWLDFSHVWFKTDGTQPVATARLMDGKQTRTVFPPGWRWEGSLSESGQFMSREDGDALLEFVGRENGLDVYRVRATGELRYIGRTKA